AADTRLAGGDNHRWASRASSVVTMLAGAALGTWFLRYSVMLPLAICSLVSAFCAVTVYIGVRRSEEEALLASESP
ncbi:MAG TPA: DUF1275 domain-containing protein, partial [Vicinamibacteria bacterium]